jgi:hypothetical protein
MNTQLQPDQVLSSWKEIAAFFGKGVRTVQRWEHELNLPVQRPGGGDKKIVFARTSDLARWMGQHSAVDPLQPVIVQDAFARVQRLRVLVLNMQKQTERLQANMARLVDRYNHVSERNQVRHGKAS